MDTATKSLLRAAWDRQMGVDRAYEMILAAGGTASREQIDIYYSAREHAAESTLALVEAL